MSIGDGPQRASSSATSTTDDSASTRLCLREKRGERRGRNGINETAPGSDSRGAAVIPNDTPLRPTRQQPTALMIYAHASDSTTLVLGPATFIAPRRLLLCQPPRNGQKSRLLVLRGFPLHSFPP
jgi:hypothetical protein